MYASRASVIPGTFTETSGMERKDSLLTEFCQRSIFPAAHLPAVPIRLGSDRFQRRCQTVDNVLKPAFNLYINGSDVQGQERMGKEIGTMLEEQIP